MAGLINEGMEEGETLARLSRITLAARGWLGPWVALAGLINEGMEDGETLARLGWVALAARGWLWPWVALAGLINEGMEEGEPWPVWAGSLWPQGAGWGRGSLWPDVLMKGWRDGETLARLGWVALAARAGWGRGSLWPDLLMKGWRRVKPWPPSGAGSLCRKGLAGAVGRFGRTY